MKLSKSNLIYNSLVYLGFLFSLVNKITLLIYLIVLSIYLIIKYKELGAIQSLYFIQLRSLINSGIGISIGELSIVKWLLVFSLSFYILYKNIKRKLKISDFCFASLLMLFETVIVISGFSNSSYPTIVLFKSISYSLVFYCIVQGIKMNAEYNWQYFIFKSSRLIIIGSLFFIISPIGYLRNGYAFQGILNHPNVFAVILALFCANYLTLNLNKFSYKDILFLGLIIFEVYLSGSRTGLLSIILIIGVYIFLLKIPVVKKFTYIIIILIMTIILLTIQGISLNDLIQDFIFKGHAEDIFYSRSDQLSKLFDRISSNPWLGTGFNVPYINGYKSYMFSLEEVVENGNLILALLADVGIIGFISFILLYFFIYVNGNKNNLLLFIAPFIVCMGEMSFFSTNNFGILLYIYFGIYMNHTNLKSDKLKETAS